jgi:hypothetical protein
MSGWQLCFECWHQAEANCWLLRHAQLSMCRTATACYFQLHQQSTKAFTAGLRKDNHTAVTARCYCCARQVNTTEPESSCSLVGLPLTGHDNTGCSAQELMLNPKLAAGCDKHAPCMHACRLLLLLLLLLSLPGRPVWCVTRGQSPPRATKPPHAPHAQHSV